jgi:hypothetical protein
VVAEGLGAIENALLDAKAKALGVPCYVLLGGKIRDRVRVYWSHCATGRINHPNFYKPAITDLDGVKAMGREVRERGFTALKTNIFIHEDGNPRGWRPGFGMPFLPELNVEKKVLRNLVSHLEAISDGAGPDIDLLLDLNFNAKTEGYLKLLRAIAHIDMFWVEIDSYSPRRLQKAPDSVRHGVAPPRRTRQLERASRAHKRGSFRAADNEPSRRRNPRSRAISRPGSQCNRRPLTRQSRHPPPPPSRPAV